MTSSDDTGAKNENTPKRGPERGALVFGLALIIAGIFFLAAQWSPDLRHWLNIERSWPLIIVGVGVFLALIGLAESEPALAIPSTIVGGIGLLLLYQNVTGDWGSWAYAWALVPGFVGLGMLLAGLLGSRRSRHWRGPMEVGAWMLAISLIVFLANANWLGGRAIGRFWPIGLVIIGAWVLLRPRRRRRTSEER